MKDSELLPYFAGFFDGEGCITITRGSTKKAYCRSPQFILVSTISNSQPAPLRLMCERFGGTIRLSKKQRSHHMDSWRWHITASRAAAFLRAIRPWLMVKHDEVDIGLELADRIAALKEISRGLPLRLSDEEIAARAKLVLRLREQPSRANRQWKHLHSYTEAIT